MAADRAPAPQLTCDDLLQLKSCLGSYLENFRSLFPRRDQGASFLAYAEGLLSGERRKSVARMVLRELDGDMNQGRRLQYFAADSAWSDQPFLERHPGEAETAALQPEVRKRLWHLEERWHGLVCNPDNPKVPASTTGWRAGWVPLGALQAPGPSDAGPKTEAEPSTSCA